jgi:hypothetical protein
MGDQIQVESFQGQMPAWKLCLQGESNALVKLSNDQAEADVLAVLRSLPQSVTLHDTTNDTTDTRHKYGSNISRFRT